MTAYVKMAIGLPLFLHHRDPEWPTYKALAKEHVAASRAAGMQTVLPCYDDESARALAIFMMDSDRRDAGRRMINYSVRRAA